MLDEMTAQGAARCSTQATARLRPDGRRRLDRQAGAQLWTPSAGCSTRSSSTARSRSRRTSPSEHRDTLVIVTADHECSGAAIIGASKVTEARCATVAAARRRRPALRDGVVGTYDAAGFPKYTIAADGYPGHRPTSTSSMLIGYGANADRYEDWLHQRDSRCATRSSRSDAAPLNTYPADAERRNDATGNYLVTGQVPGDRPCTPRPTFRCRPSAAAPRCSPASWTTPTCSSSWGRRPSKARPQRRKPQGHNGPASAEGRSVNALTQAASSISAIPSPGGCPP